MATQQSDLHSDKITLEYIFELMDDVYQATGYNLDQFVSGQMLEVSEHKLGDAIGNLFAITCKAIREMDGELDTDQIFKYKVQEKGYKVTKFLDFFKGYVDKELRPFWEVKELRHMKIEEFRDSVNFVFFNRMILLTEEKSELPEVTIKVMKKVLSISSTFVLIYRMDENKFCSEMRDVFYFDQEKGRVLYSLMKDNWQDAYQYEVTRRLLALDCEIKKLQDS